LTTRTEESRTLIGRSFDCNVDTGAVGVPEGKEPDASLCGEAPAVIEQLRAHSQACHDHPWRSAISDDRNRFANDAHFAFKVAGDFVREAVGRFGHSSRVPDATKRGWRRTRRTV